MPRVLKHLSQDAPLTDAAHGSLSRGGRPLRVCQVVPYDLADRGGVKHHAMQLARVLRSSGDDVTIVGPSAAPTSTLHTRAFPGVVNIKGNGSDNRVGLLVSPWRIWKYFREQKFDVVHVHEPLTPALPYWAAWFSPAAAHVATFHAFSERPKRALTFFTKLAAHSVRSRFQVRTAVSLPAAKSAARSWPEPMTIVPNGVPKGLFVPRPGPRPPGPIVLLFVGRIGDSRKGYRYLDAAFRRLRARGMDIRLEVVGELGGGSVPLPAPGLTYHGPLPMDQLVQRYQQADIFVAPSTGQESFGIVLLEAMAVGLPVICSDIEGYRDTVASEGSFLTPPGDEQALENAIMTLAENRQWWPAMGVVNRRRAALYDWDLVAGRVRELYLQAIQLRHEQSSPVRRQRLERMSRLVDVQFPKLWEAADGRGSAEQTLRIQQAGLSEGLFGEQVSGDGSVWQQSTFRSFGER